MMRSLIQIWTRTLAFRRTFCVIHQSGEGDFDFGEPAEYEELRTNYIVDGRKAHNVFVCYPFIKFPGGFVETQSKPELRLQELVSLVHSIPEWRVSDAGLFPVPDFQRNLFFTNNIIEQLESRVAGSPTTALLVGANRILGKQQSALEKKLKVRVLDRFSIILEIFKHHATSAEARIQLGLAEITYLRSRVNQNVSDSFGNRYSMGGTGKGAGMTAKQRYLQILDGRAKHLAKCLQKLDNNRDMIRKRRKEMQLPIVSVIGYTNSGKTSLIKALCQDGKMTPEDRLFATLQVTAHGIKLPSISKVLLLDSVGFIADLPKELINSFNVTFKDVIHSDLLLHVYDSSDPDLAIQKHTVFETMKLLKFPDQLINSTINVANKIDLLDSSTEKSPEIGETDLKVSAVEGTNLGSLIVSLDNKLSTILSQKVVKIKVPNGGAELAWLHRETKIQSIEPDTDANFLIVRASMNESQRNRFLSYFRAKKP